MTNLVFRDTFFNDLLDFRREFDEMFNRVLTGKPWVKAPVSLGTWFHFYPAVETYLDKEGKKYTCRMHLPGVDPKDVLINVQGNLLTVHGERKFTHDVKEVDLLEKEIAYGTFERTLTLPEGVNLEKVYAQFVNGVLEITGPIAAAALPRRIEIKTIPVAKPIAA